MFYRRLAGQPAPWTGDPILRSHRFTNSYRAADRVSQYLIKEVQYREDRSQAPDEVFFRTMLFKLFNKIETWEAIEAQFGPICWQSTNLERIDAMLDDRITAGERIYSAAYIMSSPPFGNRRKHSNHLALLKAMMDDRLAGRMTSAGSLQSVYRLLAGYPGLGRFLAFQFAIDLNYSSLLDFQESDFVVAGPGAADGISKCFPDAAPEDAERIIMMATERQEAEFRERGIDFPGLYGRRLQPIDCQNLFCEISKYSRVSHPEIRGNANRTRIKQVYRARPKTPPPPVFPPRWGLKTSVPPLVPLAASVERDEPEPLLL